MPTFLSIASFETRIVSYLVIYLVSLMDVVLPQIHQLKNSELPQNENFVQVASIYCFGITCSC